MIGYFFLIFINNAKIVDMKNQTTQFSFEIQILYFL